MINIDKYFLDQNEKLSYLEIKEQKEIYVDYGLNDIALPIVSDDLLEALQNEHFETGVSSEYIVDGMLYNIAIDPEFKYAEDYKHVLNNMISDPSKYAVKRGVDKLDKDINKSLIFFRAAYILDENNNYAAYNYARLLWRLELEDDIKADFVSYSIKLLEKTIAADDNFSLGFYELGNIHRALGEYLKSFNFYKNALERVEVEAVKEEIRQLMSEVEPDALVEDAIYSINRMNYSRAIELLVEAQKNSNRYDVLYYLAVSYMNQENFDLADEYFEKALKGGADFATLFIDYIYVKYTKGETQNALILANQALEKYPADLKIRYNRALIYSELGQKDKAVEDLDFILEYADLSDEFFNQVMIVKEGLLREG